MATPIHNNLPPALSTRSHHQDISDASDTDSDTIILDTRTIAEALIIRPKTFHGTTTKTPNIGGSYSNILWHFDINIDHENLNICFGVYVCAQRVWHQYAHPRRTDSALSPATIRQSGAIHNFVKTLGCLTMHILHLTFYGELKDDACHGASNRPVAVLS